MSQRKIGNASIPAIGFGAMGISAFYGPAAADEERLKVLDRAYEKGSTHWDTANVYGDSEELIGKWFKKTGKRNEIFLATKFGFSQTLGVDGSPDYVRKCAEQSLQRLGVDQIDLYYLHRADPRTPIEVTVKAMAELVKEGKVKYLGLSECSASTLRRAHAVHPISAIQVEYSPVVLDIEKPEIGLLETARELGVTVVAYSPLARGLLTGRYKSPDEFDKNDFRLTIPKYSKENFPKILELVDRIQKIGDVHKATPAQVILAWILEQGNEFVVIPGSSKLKNLEENIDAISVKLSQEEVKELRKIADEAENIPGNRYGEQLQSMLFADTPALKL